MKNSYISSKPRGFNLIEMMIGIAVGMVAMLAIAKIFVNFNHQRTVETSLMEAQSNGAMALFMLERDIDRTGYGFMELQNCHCKYIDTGGVAQDTSPSFCEGPKDGQINARGTQPIVITDGGNNSDQITLRYGTPATGLSIIQVLNKQVNKGDDFEMKTIAGITLKDNVVLNRNGACAEYQVSGISVANRTLQYAVNAQYPNNPDPTLWPTIGYETAFPDDSMINLGQIVDKVLKINTGTSQLIESNYPYTTDESLVDNIVFMKAELGLDTSGDLIVDSWSKTTVNYNQVVALRVGLVARSPVTENDSPTAATLEVLPAISGGAATTYTVPDQKYRYKVFYTIIPMRNMIWHG